MERVVRKVNLHEKQSDFAYWQTKTPAERIAAIEILRNQYIKFKNVQPGLQRIYRVVKQK